MFLAIGNILLYDSQKFSTMELGAVTLFAAGLGVFDFNDVADTGNPTIGYIYLTFYLILMAIILLNFIIAILTDIYSDGRKIGNAIYLKQVIVLNS